MKKIIVFLVIVLFIATVFVIFIAQKNLIVRRLLEKGTENTLGLRIAMDDLDVALLGTHLRIKDLRIYNPAGFEEKEMAYVPLIYIVCDPAEYFKSKKLHFYFFDLNVERFNIVKNKEGSVNIEQIKCVKSKEQLRSKKKTSFYIEIFRLNLGDIYYIDHSKGYIPKPKIYHLGIKDETFSNIDSPDDITKLVILKVLENTEIGKLINLSIIPFASDMSDVVVLTGKTVKATIKGLLDSVTAPLKIIFKSD
jgi:hypothetical protein